MVLLFPAVADNRLVETTDAVATAANLLNEQFPLVERYCNAATQLSHQIVDTDDDSILQGTHELLRALQRVHRHLEQMARFVESDAQRMERPLREHLERTKRVLNSIFQHHASFRGLDGLATPPVVAADGEIVDVRLVALATLRASIQTTREQCALSGDGGTTLAGE